MPPSAPQPGIYVPLITFFSPLPKQELDLTAHTAHLTRLAQSGIKGVVLHHPIGEPQLLSRTERTLLIQHTRNVLSSLRPNTPTPHRPAQQRGTRQTAQTSPSPPPSDQLTLIVGTSAPSTWETLELCEEAAREGADFCLVCAPCPVGAGLGEKALEGYYFNVADNSPLPLLLAPHPHSLPFPTSAQTPGPGAPGLPLPLIQRLAQHPNIVGLLIPPHSTPSSSALCSLLLSTFPPRYFLPLCASSGELLSLLVAGAGGGVLPLANVVPERVQKVWESWRDGKVEEAREEQLTLARAGAVEAWGARGIRRALDLLAAACPPVSAGAVAAVQGGKGRQPMLEMNEEGKQDVGRACKALGIIAANGEGEGEEEEGNGKDLTVSRNCANGHGHANGNGNGNGNGMVNGVNGTHHYH